MSAPLSGRFQDHYKVLGIEPDADSGTVQDAHSKLAALYHVNNKRTADQEKFESVMLAFEVLSNPAERKDYDELRAGPAKELAPRFEAAEFFKMLDEEKLRRKTLLCLLYDRRRQNPLRPGLSLKQMELLVNSTTEEIQFSVWYLKQKGYLISDDKSNTQIAMPGMDYLDGNPPDRDEIVRMLKPPAGVAQLAPLAAKKVASAPAGPHNPPAPTRVPVAVPKPDAAPATGAPRQPLTFPKRTIVIPPRAG